MYSLIVTGKLNDVDPRAGLATCSPASQNTQLARARPPALALAHATA